MGRNDDWGDRPRRPRRGFDQDFGGGGDRFGGGGGGPGGGFRGPPRRFDARPEPVVAEMESSGQVKWFNPEKGFGFVTLADGRDAFLHGSVLSRAGAPTVSPGASVRVRVGRGQKGPQVVEVLEVGPVTGNPPPPPPPRGPRPSYSGEASEMGGIVKWYNQTKGFGFITPDAGGKDVFIHASTLERSGLSQLSEGQTVRMQVVQGAKGPEARSIEVSG
jgi:CspA family cold shock protein